MSSLAIEVGGNDGGDTINLLKQYRYVHVFEPVKELCDKIRNRTNYPEYKNRVFIHECAVGDYVGEANFNVDMAGDWGCGSILEFNDNLQETWPGRTDFVVNEVRTITVTTLYEHCLNYGIGKIDFLHVDAQGYDLKVLEGLGSKITDVMAGVVEVCKDKSKALYKDQHTLDDVIKFLSLYEFNVTSMMSNDKYGNEYNVRFSR